MIDTFETNIFYQYDVEGKNINQHKLADYKYTFSSGCVWDSNYILLSDTKGIQIFALENMNIKSTIDNDTFSNLQRVFSFQVSKEYFLENPFLGIGTNKYVILVNEQYYNLPKFMKLGIHGELQRVLVENGLVGIIAYLFIWYKSWTRTKIILLKAQKNRLINKEQLNFLLYSIYLTFAFYVGTEASSTRSFLLLVIISLLPDYLGYNLSRIKNIKMNR